MWLAKSTLVLYLKLVFSPLSNFLFLVIQVPKLQIGSLCFEYYVTSIFFFVQRVYESNFVGRKSIVKERFSKKYRHPILDSKLTLKRLNAVSFYTDGAAGFFCNTSYGYLLFPSLLSRRLGA